MLITCPSCESSYTIEPLRIGPEGRKVRCATCRNSWLVRRPSLDLPVSPVLPEVGSAAAPVSPDPIVRIIESNQSAVLPTDRSAADAVLPRRTAGNRSKAGMAGGDQPLGARLAVVGAALVIAAGLLAVPLRSHVAAISPGTATLFRAIGLPANAVGLDIQVVSSQLLRDPAQPPVLEVTGRVSNTSERTRPVPPIAVSVMSGEGMPLYRWTVRTAATDLPGGGGATFLARLSAPPPGARHVEVAFAKGSDSRAVALR